MMYMCEYGYDRFKCLHENVTCTHTLNYEWNSCLSDTHLRVAACSTTHWCNLREVLSISRIIDTWNTIGFLSPVIFCTDYIVNIIVEPYRVCAVDNRLSFIQPDRMEAWQSFTDHKRESVETFETNQNERISTDGRPRHDFLQTLRSFNSKLKPDIVLINESTKDIIFGELTCPMEARMTYWHETKTRKYHNLANRIAEKGFHSPLLCFWSWPGWKVIAQIPYWRRTSEEDHWRNSHRLRNYCTEMLPKDLP